MFAEMFLPPPDSCLLLLGVREREIFFFLGQIQLIVCRLIEVIIAALFP